MDCNAIMIIDTEKPGSPIIDPYACDGDDVDKDPDYVPPQLVDNESGNFICEDSLDERNFENEVELLHNDVQMNEENDSDAISNDVTTKKEKKLTRKRKRCPEKWKKVVTKNLCEHGEEYINSKGKTCEKKLVKNTKDCQIACKFFCSKKISNEERKHINENFWILTDEGKQHFYNKNTLRVDKKRTTTESKQSRRAFSFQYFFHLNDEIIRVCKLFFLGTLNISQSRISYFYKNKREDFTGNPTEIKRGKHPKKKISDESRQGVICHINSIPRIESHYCRKRTKKEYFESGLNLIKLYRLYKEWCQERSLNPVKVSYYRKIFNFEFNVSFWKPKSDRCDICKEFKAKKLEGREEDSKDGYEKHLELKKTCYENRQRDRGIDPGQNSPVKISDRKIDKNTAVVSFDMENVFALPKAEISSFFYSKKLNTYNMTAHCNLNRKGYCAIWNEGMHGRKGIDLASAIVKILVKVVEDFPEIKKIILWSDSCVPQNRNSYMTLALKKFLEEHENLEDIVQKFSEPGHGQVQEVDNIHSQIDRKLKNAEIYSPLGLLRALNTVNKKNPLKVIQMQMKDYKDYQKAAEIFNFKLIPYCSVKQLKYIRNEPFTIYYKLDYSSDSVDFVAARITPKTRNSETSNGAFLPKIKTVPEPTKCLLTEDKVHHLYKLFKFIPEVDRKYFKSLFFEYKDENKIKKLAKKNKVEKEKPNEKSGANQRVKKAKTSGQI